ncbi:MAG: redoxin domain-containing protein [Alphaproteobacteria bacterium]|nr:redoxin domain-containing protein [Alphaproteobacteria bacterium]
MSLPPGIQAPLFTAPSPLNPQFEFARLGGRYVLLVFLPGPSPERDAALRLLKENLRLIRDDNAAVFAVLPDEASFARAVDAVNGVQWLSDPDGWARTLYRAVDEAGEVRAEWFPIDPSCGSWAAARWRTWPGRWPSWRPRATPTIMPGRRSTRRC